MHAFGFSNVFISMTSKNNQWMGILFFEKFIFLDILIMIMKLILNVHFFTHMQAHTGKHIG